MKLAGHTLGTPNYTVEEALELFAEVELGAAEVIYQDGYRAALPEGDDSAVERLSRASARTGVDIVALAPYMTGLNSLDEDERQRDLERFRRCITAASSLGAGAIRVYAGSFSPGAQDRGSRYERLVASLQELGAYAAGRSVTLCVENHFNTMTVSAFETARLCQDVGSEAVGALYDQANLTFTHCEEFPASVDTQKPWIRHVHVKDLTFRDKSAEFKSSSTTTVHAEERQVTSRIVGEGELDWKRIIDGLAQIGYQGYLSLEYEHRWHPGDLPDSATAFKSGVDYLTPLISAAMARNLGSS